MKTAVITVLVTILSVSAVVVLIKSSRTPAPATGVIAESTGNSATKAGAPFVREEHERQADNPRTINDESNDQPLGHYGSKSVYVHNISSGNSYYLDADIVDSELKRLYFPKGGWVDFYSCDLDDDGSGYCTDENGTAWGIN